MWRPDPTGTGSGSLQRKLYKRSEEQVDYVFCKLWGWLPTRAICEWLSCVSRATAAVEVRRGGITVERWRSGEEFIAELRTELRSGAYRPSPVRRVLIPKIGGPREVFALWNPTVKDRVVQAALKNILEPIFEADFFPVSYGFRPGKSVHGALEHLRVFLRPRATNKVKSCGFRINGLWKGTSRDARQHRPSWFDGAGTPQGHRPQSEPFSRRVSQGRRSLGGTFLRSDAGTPQGGILSPCSRISPSASSRNDTSGMSGLVAFHPRGGMLRRRAAG